MGADWIGTWAEYDPKLTYQDVAERLRTLTEDEIRDAVGEASGCEIEDIHEGTPHEVAIDLLGDVYYEEPARGSYISREIGEANIKGTPHLIAGGLSWGDSPAAFDALRFLDEAGVLRAAPRRLPKPGERFMYSLDGGMSWSKVCLRIKPQLATTTTRSNGDVIHLNMVSTRDWTVYTHDYDKPDTIYRVVNDDGSFA